MTKSGSLVVGFLCAMAVGCSSPTGPDESDGEGQPETLQGTVNADTQAPQAASSAGAAGAEQVVAIQRCNSLRYCESGGSGGTPPAIP